MEKKITKATLKSFIKKNLNNILVGYKSSFNSMSDMIEETKCNFSKLNIDKYDEKKSTLGLFNLHLHVDRLYIENFETSEYKGYNVYSCCGEYNIVIVK